MGRASYSSQSPVAGSRAGQGSSLANSAKRRSASSPSSSRPLVGSPGNSFASRETASRARWRTRCARSGSDSSNFSKSFTEPNSIELIDGKDSDAALRATGMTGEPFAAVVGRHRPALHQLSEPTPGLEAVKKHCTLREYRSTGFLLELSGIYPGEAVALQEAARLICPTHRDSRRSH